MRFYRKARLVQRLSILNGRDHNELVDVGQDDTLFNRVNPNRIFPWAVSGGMHDLTGWRSDVAVYLPGPVETFTRRVEAGARRALPRTSWAFPDGTVFADVLSTDKGVFEIRTRTKRDGNWSNKVAYRNAEHVPAGYTGARKACNECHDHAGENLHYGTAIRGDDETFSWSPLEK